MYLVISFDFGESSTVSIHALTANLDEADAVYEKVAEYSAQQNPEDDCFKLMVELIKIPPGFQSEEGVGLFGFGNGELPPGVQILKGNNRDDFELTSPESAAVEMRRMSLEGSP